MGGKCSNGVVLIGDRKVSYSGQPSGYREKIHKSYTPIVTGGASL